MGIFDGTLAGAVVSFGISLVTLLVVLGFVEFIFYVLWEGFNVRAARTAMTSFGGRAFLGANLAMAVLVSVLVAAGTVDMSILFNKPL